MGIPVLICDDSSFARKQMARALPDGWEVEVSFACNGEEAIQAIKDSKIKGDKLFLDDKPLTSERVKSIIHKTFLEYDCLPLENSIVA